MGAQPVPSEDHLCVNTYKRRKAMYSSPPCDVGEDIGRFIPNMLTQEFRTFF